VSSRDELHIPKPGMLPAAARFGPTRPVVAVDYWRREAWALLAAYIEETEQR
jgi:hypothetical protein